MDYVKLGRTGLEVSRLCLGCMSYGEPERGTHDWTLDRGSEPSVHPQALDRRHQFFDTANVYSDGTQRGDRRAGPSRTSPGARRSCIATKVYGRMRPGPERCRPVAQGHPHRDRREPEAPRDRLHRPAIRSTAGIRDADRGDAGGAARRGAVPARSATSAPRRCMPGSSRKALSLSDRHGWARFVSMQNH